MEKACQPSLTQCQTTIIGGCLIRFQHSNASIEKLLAQGCHQDTIHGTTATNRHPRQLMLFGSRNQPVGKPVRNRRMKPCCTH